MTSRSNVGDAKIAATRVPHLGRLRARSRRRDRAGHRVAASSSAPQVTRPALVFDIDETALSNWEVIEANDFGRFATGPCALPERPCGWAAWDQLGRSAPLSADRGAGRDRARAGRGRVLHHRPPRIAARRHRAQPARKPAMTASSASSWCRTAQRYRPAADFKAPHRAAIEAGGLHDHRQRGRPAFRPGRRARRAGVPATQPVLPDPVTLATREFRHRQAGGIGPGGMSLLRAVDARPQVLGGFSQSR